jgi:hypothetical protein
LGRRADQQHATIVIMDRKRAALALSVVRGLLDDNPQAERMALEAFDTLEDAATAYAYLVGLLVEETATFRRQPVSVVIDDLRARLLE